MAMHRGVGDRLVDPLMTRLPNSMLSRYSESGFIRSNAMLVSLIDFMTAHPRVVSAFLEGQARRADYEVGGDLVIRWFLQLVARYQLVHSALDEEDILLLDEGFCQRVVTGFGHRFSDEDHRDVDRYLASVPRPALLVHLDISVEDAAARVTDEGRVEPTKRLWGTDTDPVRFLEDASRSVDYVAESARRMGFEVLELDGSAEMSGHLPTVIARLAQTPTTGRPVKDVPSLDSPIDG